MDRDDFLGAQLSILLAGSSFGVIIPIAEKISNINIVFESVGHC